MTDRISQLERLAKLHAQGILSDEELAREKAALDSAPAASSSTPAPSPRGAGADSVADDERWMKLSGSFGERFQKAWRDLGQGSYFLKLWVVLTLAILGMGAYVWFQAFPISAVGGPSIGDDLPTCDDPFSRDLLKRTIEDNGRSGEELLDVTGIVERDLDPAHPIRKCAADIVTSDGRERIGYSLSFLSDGSVLLETGGDPGETPIRYSTKAEFERTGQLWALYNKHGKPQRNVTLGELGLQKDQPYEEAKAQLRTLGYVPLAVTESRRTELCEDVTWVCEAYREAYDCTEALEGVRSGCGFAFYNRDKDEHLVVFARVPAMKGDVSVYDAVLTNLEHIMAGAEADPQPGCATLMKAAGPLGTRYAVSRPRLMALSEFAPVHLMPDLRTYLCREAPGICNAMPEVRSCGSTGMGTCEIVWRRKSDGKNFSLLTYGGADTEYMELAGCEVTDTSESANAFAWSRIQGEE